ncbi:MAG: hypothetical protein IKU25_03420 [Clostridia bacterium]|nr:hypothetical protein [Clostridia bacterium]
MNIAEKLLKIAENTEKVFDAGKKREYDTFWDSYQNKGKKKTYMLAFAGEGWTNTTFKPKYDINVTYGYMTFRNSQITADLVELCEELGITLDFTGCTDFTQTFFNSKFRRIGEIDASSASALVSTFASAGIVTIDKLKLKNDGTQTFSSSFLSCENLANIQIEGKIGNSINFAASPLSAKSIASVVGALSPTVSGKSVTFNQAAVNAADWSETEYSSWDALVAQRPNWTFTLS